jgi:hypothetical protein
MVKPSASVARIIIVKDAQTGTVDLVDGGRLLYGTHLTDDQAAEILRPLLESYLAKHPANPIPFERHDDAA